MVKTRLDTLISQKGLTGSREKARAMILAGEVTVNGVTITKPGTQVSDDANIKYIINYLKCQTEMVGIIVKGC